LKRWAPILGKFASIQLLSQVVAFATGILIVRSLDKTDYAYYSIAIALIAAYTMVADSGISAALLSTGAKHRDDAERLGRLFSTAVRFRGIFGTLIAVPTIGLLLFLLWRNGASPNTLLVSATLVAITFVPVLSITVFQNFHRVEMNYSVLQRVTITIAVARIALIGACALVGIANLTTLLAVGAISSLSGAVYLWAAVHRRISFRAPSNSQDLQLFRRNVQKTLPMTLLLAMSEQLTTLLITFFGSTTVIAEVSALSRFSVAFVIVNAMVSDLGAPLIARTPNVGRLLAKRISGIIGAYAGFAAIGIMLVCLLRTPLLTVLGPSYRGLEAPLLIIAAGAGVLNTAYALNSINQARNWLSYSWIYAPLLVIWATLCALLLDLSDITEAAVMVATLALPALFTQLVRTAHGFRQIRGLRS
jgi:O-antigen/teichoic acid export membrane protein